MGERDKNFTSPLEGEVADRGQSSRSAGGGSGARDCICDAGEHTISVFQYVRIPKTKNAITLRAEPLIAQSVGFVFVVLTAIDLND